MHLLVSQPGCQGEAMNFGVAIWLAIQGSFFKAVAASFRIGLHNQVLIPGIEPVFLLVRIQMHFSLFKKSKTRDLE